MAKNSVTEWDETPANNTDIAGVNINEGCAPSGMNNAVRTVMAQVKEFFKSSLFRLRDSTDQTKLLAFDLSGLTTATTRTQIAPDENGRQALQAHLAGQIYGLTLSNNATDATNDIDITSGSAIDSANAHVMTLASTITKRLDAAWAVGSGNGGLDTGSIADTTYHIYLIKRVDTGVVDALFSASASSPTMPANYTLKRRIGSIVRTGAAIKGFTQREEEFYWLVPAADVNATNPGTSEVARTLTVPLGIQVRAIISGYLSWAGSGDGYHRIYCHAEPSTAPSASNFTHQTIVTTAFRANVGRITVPTFTNGNIFTRHSTSAAADNLVINTLGYIDTRGKV